MIIQIAGSSVPIYAAAGMIFLKLRDGSSCHPGGIAANAYLAYFGTHSIIRCREELRFREGFVKSVIQGELIMKKFSGALLLLVMSSVLGLPAFADDLPLALQAVLSVRVMEQDNKLTPSGGTVSIGIIGGDAQGLAAQFAQLNGKGVTVKGASITATPLSSGWESSASNYNVIYILSGSASSAIKATRAAQVLSISGTNGADNAAAGASVGLAMEDGKPKIYLNMTGVMAEAQEFSAQMLTLATVLK
jgi:hypothetical protein